uniref:G-protein coupled receptors family 1 profile domain-containing protein n=1 Tax=Panagrolaimus davidi TaxID=227884 RepID=A0A914PYN0_9BILA
MAAWVCTIEILFTLFLAIIVTIPIHPNLFYALYNTVSILYSTLNPYILIFCSQYTRNLLLETLFEIKNIFSRVSNAASSSVAAAAAAMPSQNQIKPNLRGNETRAAKNKSGSIVTITTF